MATTAWLSLGSLASTTTLRTVNGEDTGCIALSDDEEEEVAMAADDSLGVVLLFLLDIVSRGKLFIVTRLVMDFFAVLKAKDQFVAVACAPVPHSRKTGVVTAQRLPPICRFVSMAPLLVEWGKKWVMSVESRRLCTVKGKERNGTCAHLFVLVSPTLGVVDCGSFLCPDTGYTTCISAAFSDGNTFLMEGHKVGSAWVFVVDRSGSHVQTLASTTEPSDDFTWIGVNEKWLILCFNGDLGLWRLVDGGLPDYESDLSSTGVYVSHLIFGVSMFPFDLDKAILLYPDEIQFVDLVRTFESKTLVIEKSIGAPGAVESIWVNNTLHTLHWDQEASLWQVFNTNTKKIVHKFPSLPGSFMYTYLGPHQLCQINSKKTMTVFNSSDFTPCCVIPLPGDSFPVRLIPTNCGFVPVVVPTSSTTTNISNHTHTSKCLDLCLSDPISGVVLAHLHCQL
ncbi:hypothetical protein Pelo_15091 [Pelomyxa schiedti]|nr:hypothetical protein Pelo_15091 [Pelomyxa schiedti]